MSRAQSTLSTMHDFSDAVYFENLPLREFDTDPDPESRAIRRVAWLDHNYGDTVMLSTSFANPVLLHLVKRVLPHVKIVFADTQHLHPETYDYIARLIDRLDLGGNLHIYKAHQSRAEQEALYGRPWESGDLDTPEMHAYRIRNKVEPVNRAIQELGIAAWISGRRREQSEKRANIRVLEQQGEITKQNPLADWTSRDVYQYIMRYKLPQHPLWEKGYTNIGDFFEGPEKGECGLHDLSVARPAGAHFSI